MGLMKILSSCACLAERLGLARCSRAWATAPVLSAVLGSTAASALRLCLVNMMLNMMHRAVPPARLTEDGMREGDAKNLPVLQVGQPHLPCMALHNRRTRWAMQCMASGDKQAEVQG